MSTFLCHWKNSSFFEQKHLEIKIEVDAVNVLQHRGFENEAAHLTKKKKVIPCTVYSLALLSSTITIRFSDLKKSLTFECHFSSEPKLLHFKLLSQFLRGFLCFGFWVGKGISLLANSKTTLYCCLLMKGLAVLGLDVKSLNLKSLAANYYQHVGFYLKWAKKTTNKFSL